MSNMILSNRLRGILRSEDYRDGVNVHSLSILTDSDSDSVGKSLRTMPDAYIDRWELHRISPGPGRRYTPVWCVVVPPENCPPPSPQQEKKL
jgi:hypothetical protein